MIMEHLEVIAKIASIVGTIFLGGKWILGRIESGQKIIQDQQRKMLKKIDKKVSHTECRDRQASCPCVLAFNSSKGDKK